MRAISFKTSFLLVIGMLAAWVVFIALAPVSKAQTIGYAGYCVIDDATRNRYTVQAKTTDEVTNFNNLYFQYWSRDAQCDELQFQVDHQTPHETLANWLQTTKNTRFPWMEGTAGVDRHESQTVSVTGGKMYLIKDGESHRVFDFPTALSWGLNKDHRRSVDPMITPYLYERWPEGESLQYAEGPFREGVQEYWNTRQSSIFPASLSTASPDLSNYMRTSIYGDTIGAMLWRGNFSTDRSLNALYDWSYLYN